jgi:hypothetical protein
VLPYLAVALLGFAIVARSTRFLNSDVLAQPIRDRVLIRFGEGRISYLVTCPWCASIWISAPVALYADLVLLDLPWRWDVFVTVGLWLGWSYAYGLLSSQLDDE